VTIGGYKSRDPYPTVGIEAMVTAGELRYVWVTSASVIGAARASDSDETLQAVTDWIAAHGEAVDAAEYGGSSEGTLYDLGGPGSQGPLNRSTSSADSCNCEQQKRQPRPPGSSARRLLSLLLVAARAGLRLGDGRRVTLEGPAVVSRMLARPGATAG
jgi:hypothetical protein